ncbi:MAG: SH3 domain-containing protein [Chloroflexota bacterium]
MNREEFDPENERMSRTSRQPDRSTERLSTRENQYGTPVRQNWRSDRPGARKTSRTPTLPTSGQEVMALLQDQRVRTILIIVAVCIVLLFLFITLSNGVPLGGATAEEESPDLNAQISAPNPTITPESATQEADSAVAEGAQLQVFDTGELGLFLRAEPNTSPDNPPIKTLPDGSVVTVIGQDYTGPERVWKNIRDAEGAEGWVATEFLEPVE